MNTLYNITPFLSAIAKNKLLFLIKSPPCKTASHYIYMDMYIYTVIKNRQVKCIMPRVSHYAATTGATAHDTSVQDFSNSIISALTSLGSHYSSIPANTPPPSSASKSASVAVVAAACSAASSWV